MQTGFRRFPEFHLQIKITPETVCLVVVCNPTTAVRVENSSVINVDISSPSTLTVQRIAKHSISVVGITAVPVIDSCNELYDFDYVMIDPDPSGSHELASHLVVLVCQFSGYWRDESS